MTTFGVMAAAGDHAGDLRSLGTFKAPTARLALQTCLARLDRDPVSDFQAQLHDFAWLADLLRLEQV